MCEGLKNPTSYLFTELLFAWQGLIGDYYQTHDPTSEKGAFPTPHPPSGLSPTYLACPIFDGMEKCVGFVALFRLGTPHNND